MQFLFAAIIKFDFSKESCVSELSAFTYFKAIFNSFKIYGKEKINGKIKKNYLSKSRGSKLLIFAMSEKAA